LLTMRDWGETDQAFEFLEKASLIFRRVGLSQ
jgi:hypothetical protein